MAQIDDLIIESIRGGELPKCQLDTSLSTHSWIHRGGAVKYWWAPENYDELVTIGRFLYEKSLPFLTIGHTSNIYFRDSFSIDHVIDTRKLTQFNFVDNGSTIICDCGVHTSKLSKYAIENGIAGYEGMINLPGTVGGAIVNNSGCYNCSIENVLKSIELLTPEGEIIILDANCMNYQFRSSDIKTGKLKGIILRAFFDASQKDSSAKLIDIAKNNTHNRLTTQDSPAKNLGSTVNCNGYNKNFKNTLLRVILKFYRIFVTDPIKNYRLSKSLILILYGKCYLSKYISDKRMQCYLWKDHKADEYFDDYLDLIRRVYKRSSIEIEIYS